MCPFLRKRRENAKYDIYGKMIDYTVGYYCILDKGPCIQYTKVTILNKAGKTDVGRTRPDGTELFVVDEEGYISRHGTSVL